MAMIKIGTSYYNGDAKPIYLIQGTAVRDGEDAPVRGKDHGKVSVAAATRDDESTLYVTVNGWRSRAAEVAAIRKMDSVLAIGTLKTSDYNGRKYYDLDADFICLSGVGGGVAVPFVSDSSVADALPDLPELSELPDSDGELPF